MKPSRVKGWIVGGCLFCLLGSHSFVLAQAANPGPQILVKSFQPEGNTLISTRALEALFERYIGTWPIPEEGLKLTPAQLRRLLEATLQFYLRLGNSGIYVYIPQDSIAQAAPLAFKDDVLRVRIVEGTVKEVSTRYRVQKKWRLWDPLLGEKKEARPASHDKRQQWISRWVPVKTGSFVRKKDLENFADFLERHPGRSAAAVVHRVEGEAAAGEVGKEVAVEIRVLDADPLTFYLQGSNTGSSSTGEERFRLGLIHNNLTNHDDIFNFDFQASADENALDNYGVFASYDAPLWNPRWRGRVLAARSEFESSDILGPSTPFIGKGTVAGGELRYNIWQKNGWFLDLFQAIDFQNSKVQTPFGFSSDIDLLDISIGARIERNKPDYQASFEAKVSYNLTDAFDLSTNADFANSRFGTEPGYTVVSFRGSHRKPLRNGIAIYQQFAAQFSEDRLVSAKELSVGGLDTVRGYNQFELLGDRGVYLSTEPRLALNTLLPSLRDLSLNIDLVPVFFDVGYLSIKDAIAGEDPVKTVYSIGSGARVYYRDLFFGRFYWGRALKDAGDNAGDTKSGDNQFHFDMTLRF